MSALRECCRARDMTVVYTNLICKSIHDDWIRNQAQRMNFTHQNVGRNFMELNVFQEIPNDFLQWNILVKKLFTFSGLKFANVTNVHQYWKPSCLPGYCRNIFCSTWVPPGIWWIRQRAILRGPISNGRRAAGAAWNCPNSEPRFHAHRQIRAPFEPDFWCTCTEYIVRPMPAGHTLCPHWCNTERIRHKRGATLRVHSSRPRSWRRATCVAAMWRSQCECTRSVGETHPVRILQWSASDVAGQTAIEFVQQQKIDSWNYLGLAFGACDFHLISIQVQVEQRQQFDSYTIQENDTTRNACTSDLDVVAIEKKER